jgi:hypothetical protein
MKIGFAVICLSAAALALPSLASAEDASITAFGHTQGGWLHAAGPDAKGLYRVAVDIADLDPATDAGWSAMASRAQSAAMALCEISAEGPQIAGYSNKSLRRCMNEASGLAARQMTEAREARHQGRAVATLGMAAMK